MARVARARGEKTGLTFDNVAFVHFRAAKNVRSPTVHALLRAAERIRRNSGASFSAEATAAPYQVDEAMTLSKEELEGNGGPVQEGSRPLSGTATGLPEG